MQKNISSLKKFFRHRNNVIQGVALLVALIPIFFFSSRFQGWGGDYAGYLLEARNIADGKSLATSNYIYNPGYAELAPPAYPVGFPILLAPVYKIYGLDILEYTRLIGIIWWMIGAVMFLLFKRYFSSWVALGGALVFMYHPLFMFERNAVLSDYPFVVSLLLSVFFYTASDTERSLKNAGVVGFFAGYAWLIRSVGFVLPVVIVGHFLLEKRYRSIQTKDAKENQWWLYPGILMGVALGMQLLFHGVFFKLPETGSYFDQINPANLTSYFKDNIATYTKTLLNYFQLNEDLWYIYRYKSTDMAVAFGGAIGLGLMVQGFMLIEKTHERLFIGWLVVYGLVILFWPSFQGLRFLLPMLPFLVYFILKAIDRQQFTGKWKNRIKWWILPALLFGEYNRIDQHIFVNSQVDEIGSPEWKDNQAAYRYCRDSLPSNVIFSFHHPLIFALYANKPVVRWPKNVSPLEIQADFEKYKVDYLLLNDWLVAADEPLKNYLKENTNRLDTVWHNERNVLYKLK